MVVLHVIDGGFRGCRRGDSDPELELRALGCALLQRGLQRPQKSVLVGPGWLAERAARSGLRIDAMIAPPMGSPAGAWLLLRRYVEGVGRPAAVMCWGNDAARLAHRALGDTVPRILVNPEGDPAPECAHTLVYGGAARGRMLDQGTPERDVSVAPPPIVATPVSPGERARMRGILGCGGPSIVVVAVGTRVDAVRFAFGIGLMQVAGVHVTGVIGGHAAQQIRAARLCAAEPRLRLIESNRPMSDLLAAADIGVFEGNGSGPTTGAPAHPWTAPAPILEAFSRGVPVVAPEWANTDGLFPADAAPHLLAYNSSLPELARKAARLIDHDAIRLDCAEAAMRSVRQRNAADDFVARVGQLVDSVIDEAAAVEALM